MVGGVVPDILHAASDRLKEYEYASKKVTTEYIDPEKKPAAASQYQIQQEPTLLFKYKDRTERISTDTEQDVAWFYPSPIPEQPKIRGLIAFFNERVDIDIDGEPVERPDTQWSPIKRP